MIPIVYGNSKEFLIKLFKVLNQLDICKVSFKLTKWEVRPRDLQVIPNHFVYEGCPKHKMEYN